MILAAAIQSALNMSRAKKRTIALVIDSAICMATVLLAFYLRLGHWVIPVGTQWLSIVSALVFALPLFVVFGMYRAIFRYAGWGALMAVARACAIYGLLYAALFTTFGVPGVPRTIGLIQPVLLFLAIGGSRASVRYVLGGHMGFGVDRKVLIYGAGSSGRQLASAIVGSNEMRVAGFIDDDPTLHSSVLNGRRIHNPARLTRLVEREGVTDILLAMPSATRKRRSEILEALRPLGVSVRTVPGVMDLANGRFEVSSLRELEIEDLLGRDVAAPNQILFARNILGKTVLVTGAGGSIGSELCRQILTAKPAILLLFDINEYALYAINQELDAHYGEHSDVRIVPLLGSVRDSARLADIMAAWKPHTVYHAAAYKHVPLVEHNPVEGLRNNVFGTLTTARAAQAAGVADFVLVSTDKAVRPTNVMGTSKRLAEMALQALASDKIGTRFSMVRFGNVLGSSGSVVPLFREQIKRGGPVTITHPDITRYFMTIPEAAQLVIQAGAMGGGGEVFILDMGEPVRIVDLAHKMIALSGVSLRDENDPHGDVAIEVVGLRPGEKLYEELLIGDNPSPTSHPLIMKARERFLPLPELESLLNALTEGMDANDVPRVQQLLRRLVPEYAPNADLPDWTYLQKASG